MVYQKGGHDAEDSAGGGQAVREQEQRHRDDHQASHQDALHRLLEDRQVLVRVQEVAVVHPRLQLWQTYRILERLFFFPHSEKCGLMTSDDFYRIKSAMLKIKEYQNRKLGGGGGGVSIFVNL
jgi:hypothetical protein